MNMKVLKKLVFIIITFSFLATLMGIFYDLQGKSYNYTSIRGETIRIYGKGLYKHMSAEVAIQGIAQDYVTLLIGIPFLVIGYTLMKKNYIKGKLLLTGTVLYFFLTYLFYTAMGMYNEMFLVYVSLLCFSFVTLVILLISFEPKNLKSIFNGDQTIRFVGKFLIFNSILVGSLWLSNIIQPLLDGTLYPEGLEHYTTLIVQGFDLGLFLPSSFISGYLVLKNNELGYLFAPVYIIFLSFLMTALTSKLLFMAKNSANVIPAIFIMPTIAIISMISSVKLIKKVQERGKSGE
ncbi:MAG TPA: hypothetical protein VJ962_06710 [Clostridia bacterium]|nr:hypothetical protein [Clostridia bacterium]